MSKFYILLITISDLHQTTPPVVTFTAAKSFKIIFKLVENILNMTEVNLVRLREST